MSRHIYHPNGQIAFVGPGQTNSGFAYHDNGNRALTGSGTGRGTAYHKNGNHAFIGPGRTDSGFGYYKNGNTAFVGPGRTNSGYAYYENGQIFSRDGGGIGYEIGPGLTIWVSNRGLQLFIYGRPVL